MTWEDVLKNEGNIDESDVRLAISEAMGYLEQLLWNPTLPKGPNMDKVRTHLMEELGKMGYNEQSNPPLSRYVNTLGLDKMYELAGIDKNSPHWGEDERFGGTPRTR